VITVVTKVIEKQPSNEPQSNSSNDSLEYRPIKQGAITCRILFCAYLDGLLKILKDYRVGCYVGDLCVAALAHVVEIVLLATTFRVMEVVLETCEDNAFECAA
jgi:hypothetical protein